jgi:signal transduction histidine kinase
MQERVSLLGGSFELIPEPDGGARADINLPLTREKNR